MITSVPPSTRRILPPTTTDPPTPTPKTIHPTWALAVWPSLTVSVLEALKSVELLMEFRVVVDLAVVVAGGGDDFGVLVDVGSDSREIGDFGFWLVVSLTDIFGVGIVVG